MARRCQYKLTGSRRVRRPDTPIDNRAVSSLKLKDATRSLRCWCAEKCRILPAISHQLARSIAFCQCQLTRSDGFVKYQTHSLLHASREVYGSHKWSAPNSTDPLPVAAPSGGKIPAKNPFEEFIELFHMSKVKWTKWNDRARMGF